MVDLTWEEVFRHRDGLHAFLRDIGNFLDWQGYEPKSGSRASAEISQYAECENPGTAYAQSFILIECVADHAFAMINTLRSPGQTIAPWTCARAMLEASSVACWLLDTSIEAVDRIERSIAFRKEGLIEQRKLLSILDDDEKVSRVAKKLEELEVTARRLGLPARYGRAGKLVGHCRPMPSFTDLARDFLQEESSYRIFSAMLHGHEWALTQLGFHPVDPLNPRVLEKNTDPLAAALLIYKAANCLSRPVWCISQLYSYDTVALKAILSSAYDSIGISPDSEFRFWRE